jgi:glycosyltransferase involved in cell wall biosynthesis
MIHDPQSMIIGIDASKAASKGRTGVENFVYQVILNLQKFDQENTYFLYTNSPLPEELKANSNFQEKFINKEKYFNKIHLPLALLRDKPELFLEMSYALPRFAPKKSVAVCHDLAWLYFPKAYTFAERQSQKSALDSVCHAAKIITPSKSAKKDLAAYKPKVKDKIEVIYLAGRGFCKLDAPRNILNLSKPYFLSIGRLEERKNTQNIIKAYEAYRENGGQSLLCLIGKAGTGFDKIEKTIKNSKYQKDIICPGFVKNEDLNDLLSGATAFLYPSLYEGFGIAALEAMEAGAPVITANTSSLPEAVGDAAIQLDPYDTEEIAACMTKIESDQAFRDDLINKGLARAKEFTWESTAQKIHHLLESL